MGKRRLDPYTITMGASGVLPSVPSVTMDEYADKLGVQGAEVDAVHHVYFRKRDEILRSTNPKNPGPTRSKEWAREAMTKLNTVFRPAFIKAMADPVIRNIEHNAEALEEHLNSPKRLAYPEGTDLAAAASAEREVRDMIRALPTPLDREAVLRRAVLENDVQTLRAIELAPNAFPVFANQEFVEEQKAAHIVQQFPEQSAKLGEMRSAADGMRWNARVIAKRLSELPRGISIDVPRSAADEALEARRLAAMKAIKAPPRPEGEPEEEDAWLKSIEAANHTPEPQEA